ncbi:MAG: FkbM family methyltransferase [Dehalobacterium sp.]
MLEEIYNMVFGKNDYPYNDFIALLKERNIVLYGAGGIGYCTSNILRNKGCNVCYFIDDDQAKQGTTLNGIQVLPLKNIHMDSEFVILICVPNHLDVYHKLISLGYKDVWYFPVMMMEKGFYDLSLIQKNWNKISQAYHLLTEDFSKQVFSTILKHRITMDFSYFTDIISEKQYFPSDIFMLNGKECFVDGGAYHGETIVDFINITHNNFKYIYGFEPDKKNFMILAESIKHMGKRLQLFNAGLYSESGEIGFNSQGNSSSSISETGKDRILLVKLDEVVNENKPTYIKLDIEGAEEKAIYGMRNTLTTYLPKLAISIYHKATDLWELPLVICNMVSSYKIYIRHYTNDLNETVCYAI